MDVQGRLTMGSSVHQFDQAGVRVKHELPDPCATEREKSSHKSMNYAQPTNPPNVHPQE